MAILANRRLLVLCGAIFPIFLIYILNINVLIKCLLLGLVPLLLYGANVAKNGGKLNFLTKSPAKLGSRRIQNGGVRNDRLVSPVRPFHRNKLHVTEKDYDLLSGSGRTKFDDPRLTCLMNNTPLVLSPILPVDDAFSTCSSSTQKFFPTKLQTVATTAVGLPIFSKHSDNSPFSSTGASLARSPLSSVRLPSDSPLINSLANTTYKNSSPQHAHLTSTTLQHQNYPKPAMFPLPNRHYPTHQPDYTRTSMGILPASSIFYGDGMASSIGALRKGERLRTHSPVTIKIARPDNRRSASPLFRRLSLERSNAGSPLHKEAVLAALNEKRKRMTNDDQDDTSSVMSSVLGGAIAKRRRLENGSQCSTPSQTSTRTSLSVQVNGVAASESSIEGASIVKSSTLWTGATGLQSRTPRNPIASSVSSSKRAALANMRRKRMLLQPAKPESSPSKKSCLPNPDDSPEPPDVIPYTDRPKSGADDSKSARQNKESKLNSEQSGNSKDLNSLEAGTPTTAARKNLLGSRVKMPNLKTLGDHLMKNSSPPGQYTAADLQEDRHLAKQRVNYILESLKDREETKETSKLNDQQKSTDSDALAPQVTSSSTEPTVSSTISDTNLLKLSKMNTLPVTAVQTGQLLLPNSKSEVAKTSKDTPPQALSSETPATSSQPAPPKSTLTGFFPSSGVSASTTGGLTFLDSAKPTSTPSSTGLQSEASKPATSERNRLLKGILANPNLDATSQSTVTNGNLGLATGKLGGLQGTSPGFATSTQNTGGLFSQAAPNGFSITSGIATSTGSQQNMTDSSMFQQNTGGGLVSATTTSSLPSLTTTQGASSGFQFGAPVTKPTTQNATSTAPLQFRTPTQVPQSNASARLNSKPSTNLLGSFPTSSPSTLTKAAQPSSSFVFGGAASASTTAKTTATNLNLGGGIGIFGNQMPSTAGSSTLLNSSGTVTGSFLGGSTSTTTVPSFMPAFGQPVSGKTPSFNPATTATGSFFGSATSTTTAPSFTPAFGEPVSSTTPNFNFSTQPQSAGSTSTSNTLQFKPAFGAPTQPQIPQTQPFQYGAFNTSQPAATSATTGGFTFNTPAPATTSSVFASPLPFQPSTPSMTGAPFGQQLSTPTPSFGAPASQQANPFGGPAAGQSMFGSQPTGTPSTSSFNFGAQVNSQPNSSAFAFGQQPSQSSSGSGAFQFGQSPSTNQPVTPSLGGLSTPSKPPSFNFGSGVGASSGFGTPAPSAVPSFGGVTPTGGGGGFNLGSAGSMAPKRTSRLTRHNRQTRRR